jgi:hypothetical protein
MEAATRDNDTLDIVVEAAAGVATDVAVIDPTSQVTAPPRARGHSKKFNVPGAAVKLKKELTPEERASESRK